MNTIDVDVGGTFTDLVLTLDGETSYRKVPTTPYDLSVGFMQVVEEAAARPACRSTSSSRQVETVRYSTTVAMNRLLERSGPRVALITTEGHEDATLIGKGAQWIDGTRARRAARAAAPEQAAADRPARADRRASRSASTRAARSSARSTRTTCASRFARLVDRGARAFVVSLLWSFVNPRTRRRSSGSSARSTATTTSATCR